MRSRKPNYLLFTDHDGDSCDSRFSQDDERSELSGEWRFFLESLEDEDCVEAADVEPNVTGERLELLAVVRGLEALNQPSRVTLVTPSRYVSRGIRFGMKNWRTSNWRWERHGHMVPVKNADLWRRVDRAMEIHTVQCRRWRVDDAHDTVKKADQTSSPTDSSPRPIHAARQIVRAVRNGLAAAMKVGERNGDFAPQSWSLAH